MLKKLKTLLDSNDNSAESEYNILEQFQEIFTWLNSLNADEFRINHFELSELMHQEGSSICLPFLCKIIIDKLDLISNIITYDDNKKIVKKLSDDEFFEFITHCMSMQSSNEFRILDYRVPSPLAYSAEVILKTINDLLDHFALTPLEEENLPSDLATLGTFLGVSRELSKKEGVLYETYMQWESVLERLSRDGFQQLARDHAEEAIYCSIFDGHAEYGHYCRFSLACLQYNPIDAAIHGCLLVNSISSIRSVSKSFQFRLLNTIFIFFRNFNFFELAEIIFYKILSICDLEAYDEQKIHMAYLNLLLIQDPYKALLNANEYSKKNLDKIKFFGNASAVPWLALLCNLRILCSKDFPSCDGLITLEKHIEKTLADEQINSIRGMFLPDRKNTKNILINAFDKLHLTRNKSDHIHEVRRIQVIATRLLETSLESGDIEGIILAHRAMSDGSMAFELSKGLPFKQLIRHDSETLSKFKGKNSQYFHELKTILKNRQNYRYLWLGFLNQELYFILHDEGEFIAQGIIPNLKKMEILKWLNESLPDFGFIDSPKINNPFITREDIWFDESKNIREHLPKLYIPKTDKHTIVFCDTDMACFPHNLLLEPTESKSNQAICNPLSLDNYLNYNKLNINISKISVWAPLIENDTAILLAHGRLMQHIKSEEIILSEKLIPEFKHQTDLKVFICHGGRARNGGFTGLYPSDDKKYTSSSILGNGKVAILFVCHGGHIHSDIYAKSFQTLTKNLLLAGYETVIAPAWSLNVVIPGPWLEEFLNSLKLGSNIIDASLQANNKIKEIYPVESAWAAMHVFGNPNIAIAL
ncbi:hypothetical protein [Acinetobacter pollinis]|uniref:CHAT domain-containing protein n=1 Tax=Acinetobacter pollinis TaxID=2605270 RepID=A0ABU6DWL3_9GAMM|nr:hypothetical protein [Acinetobacter pollinis]MEB5477818.1 hypothetical protein [Acinetobacter pollinis]